MAHEPITSFFTSLEKQDEMQSKNSVLYLYTVLYEMCSMSGP